MKTSIPILSAAAVLAFLSTTTLAQDNPAPAAAAAEAPAQTEMQKWIATTDAQWQATFKRDVTDVHEADLNKMKAHYLAALEEGIKKASAANDLKGALALRNEQKRFGDTQVFPEKDEDEDAAPVKAVRATIRVQLTQTAAKTAARAKALHAKYDQVLTQAQTQLTKAQRLDDAQLVQAKRDEVKAAWLAGIPEAPPPVVAEQRKPEPAAANPKPPMAKAEPLERNLFKNPNFENGTDGWDVNDFGKHENSGVDTKDLHNGKPTLRIEIARGGFVFVKQSLVGKPNTRYRLSGYIKTRNVENVKKNGKAGACLMVGFTADVRNGTSQSLLQSKAWTKVSVDFTTTNKTDLRVGMGLGWYASDVTGTAWYSDLSLVELGPDKKK